MNRPLLITLHLPVRSSRWSKPEHQHRRQQLRMRNLKRSFWNLQVLLFFVLMVLFTPCVTHGFSSSNSIGNVIQKMNSQLSGKNRLRGERWSIRHEHNVDVYDDDGKNAPENETSSEDLLRQGPETEHYCNTTILERSVLFTFQGDPMDLNTTLLRQTFLDAYNSFYPMNFTNGTLEGGQRSLMGMTFGNITNITTSSLLSLSFSSDTIFTIQAEISGFCTSCNEDSLLFQPLYYDDGSYVDDDGNNSFNNSLVSINDTATASEGGGSTNSTTNAGNCLSEPVDSIIFSQIFQQEWAVVAPSNVALLSLNEVEVIQCAAFSSVFTTSILLVFTNGFYGSNTVGGNFTQEEALALASAFQEAYNSLSYYTQQQQELGVPPSLNGTTSGTNALFCDPYFRSITNVTVAASLTPIGDDVDQQQPNATSDESSTRNPPGRERRLVLVDEQSAFNSDENAIATATDEYNMTLTVNGTDTINGTDTVTNETNIYANDTNTTSQPAPYEDDLPAFTFSPTAAPTSGEDILFYALDNFYLLVTITGECRGCSNDLFSSYLLDPSAGNQVIAGIGRRHLSNANDLLATGTRVPVMPWEEQHMDYSASGRSLLEEGEDENGLVFDEECICPVGSELRGPTVRS